MSRLFGFLVVLYGVFLICHLLLPKRLADSLFSLEEHEQRTLLIGPIDKARRFSKWIENTAAFRFGVKGTVTGDDDREDEARILHLNACFGRYHVRSWKLNLAFIRLDISCVRGDSMKCRNFSMCFLVI